MMIKRFNIVFILLFASAAVLSQPREKQSINSDWQFVLNDKTETVVDDLNIKWQRINLPHTWNAKDVIDDTLGYHQGIGWYRKLLSVPEQWNKKHIELYFEGACNRAEVFVNGVKAGEHNGGFTGFCINLDEKISFTKPNEILVKVDNSKYWQDSIPPFSGDFNLMGGIYRDVWLIATNKIHFSNKFGNNGILFETNSVNKSKASYTIKCFFSDHPTPQTGSIEYHLSYNNAVVKTAKRKLAGKDEMLVLRDDLSLPRLWSPETPNLYQLTVQLKNERGDLIDEISQSIGFKWVAISDKKEFLLNGEPYKLKGASRHQDYDGIGNALPDALHVKDVQLMKEMGCNFIRIAHYPQDPALYEACDKIGLIAWSEIPVVDKVVNNATFFKNSELMMKEMILQHYNHPSVAIWGYHNEVRNLDAATIAHAKMLDSISKSLDKMRLTTIAFESNLDAAYFSSPLLKQILCIADINGYNVYQGWYRGSFQNISAFLDTLYNFNPAKPIMLSEYGAGSNINIHSTWPSIFDFSEEYQQLFHEAYVKAGNEKPWMIGFGIWNFIDFQRDGREDVSVNINDKGMVTTSREPKDVFYFYKSQWSKEPFVYIAGKNWQKRIAAIESSSSEGLTQQVVVYSNQTNLNCSCNGVSLSPSKADDGKFVYTVSFKEGSNNLLCQTAYGKLSDALTVNYSFIAKDSFSTNNSWTQLNFNTGQTRSFFIDNKTNEQWIPDKAYTNSSWGYVDGEVWNNWPSKTWNGVREGIHKPIANTNNEPLFQTFVEGLTEWKADVPPGKYRVSILLAEPFTSEQRKTEERSFAILLNGEVWRQEINLEKEFGVQAAAILDKEMIVKPDEGIRIEFKSISGKTILNGVSIKRL